MRHSIGRSKNAPNENWNGEKCADYDRGIHGNDCGSEDFKVARCIFGTKSISGRQYEKPANGRGLHRDDESVTWAVWKV